MTTFFLPDLGEGLQDAELLSWHVSEGDHVTADQPLVSVETDKAVIEIPAPESGRIIKLFAQPGDIVPVGAPLMEYGSGPAEDAGAIVGDLETEDRRAPSPPAPAAAAMPTAHGISAAPAVRALARDLGVDLARVEPTGKRGEITREDVRNAATVPPAGRAAPAGRTETLRGVRRAMAIRMQRSGRTIVPATLHEDADISAWPDSRELLPQVIGALVTAARAQPALNAWYDWDAQQRTLFQAVNIGIAVDTPDGLIVPVLKDAGAIPRAELPDRLKQLIAGAHDRTLLPGDLRDATVTLSNFGALAGRYANLVIVPPQVAILGVGRARGSSLPLSLTIDHRTVSGGEAARFLSAFIAELEDLRQGEA